MPLDGLSALALTVWQHGVDAAFAALALVVRRVAVVLGYEPAPELVSMALRELVRAKLVERLAPGFRRPRPVQLEVV